MGISSQEVSFLKTTLGELLYEDVIDKDDTVVSRRRSLNLNVATYSEVSPSANESYSTITPDSAESFSEISPSGSESYTEVTPESTTTETYEEIDA